MLSEDGGTPGAGSVYSAILSASRRTGSSNWWSSNTWGGGSGQKAVRGALQAEQQFQQRQAGVQDLAQRQSEAERIFAATSPSGVGQVFTFDPDPRVQKLAQAVRQVQGALAGARDARKIKKLQKQELKKEMKLERRLAATAGETQVRVGELYGPNAGYSREWNAPDPNWLHPNRENWA